MPNEAQLINPNGNLLPELERLLFRARKSKPLWAKRVEQPITFDSLEGRQAAQPGDYLCRGIQGEWWPQKEKKLLETYDASGVFDDDGWQRFDPKPNAPIVHAAAVSYPFQVVAHWGQLHGKPGDYAVRSSTDPSDIWIVDKVIFENSYQILQEL